MGARLVGGSRSVAEGARACSKQAQLPGRQRQAGATIIWHPSGPRRWVLAPVRSSRITWRIRAGADALADSPFTGAAGGAACGDLVRLAVRVEHGRVVDAGFDARGCGAAIAAGSAVVELVRRRAAARGRAAHARGRGRRARRPDSPEAPRRRARGRRAASRAGRGCARRRGEARVPAGPHARGDERRGGQRGRRPARARRRGGGRGCHPRALVASRERRRALLLLAARGGRRPGAGPFDGHPALHARPARGLPRGGRGRLPRGVRGRPNPQPVRALQRDGPLRRDARAGRAPGRGDGSRPATTRA